MRFYRESIRIHDSYLFSGDTFAHGKNNSKRDSAYGANGRPNEDAAAAGRAGGPERSVLRLREHRRRARAFGDRGRGTKPGERGDPGPEC